MEKNEQNHTEKKIIIVIVVAAAVMLTMLLACCGVSVGAFFLGAHSQKKQPAVETIVIDENKHTVADFSKVVVEQAQRESLLVVDEQEMSVTSTITQEGIVDWNILRKTQMVTYYGTAQYTVDLSELSQERMVYDEDKNELTIYVSRPTLHTVSFDPNKTVVGDVEKGLLAFGEIKLTPEQTKTVEEEATMLLTEAAKEQECFDKADKYALYVLRELFEDTIESVDESTKVEVVYMSEEE